VFELKSLCQNPHNIFQIAYEILHIGETILVDLTVNHAAGTVVGVVECKGAGRGR